VFDSEWEFVLEEAKRSKNLAGVHELLHKWRFFALEELRKPGWYGSLQAKAEQILHTGVNPGAVSWEDMQKLLGRRRVNSCTESSRRRDLPAGCRASR